MDKDGDFWHVPYFSDPHLQSLAKDGEYIYDDPRIGFKSSAVLD